MKQIIYYVVIGSLWVSSVMAEDPLHERMDTAVRQRQAVKQVAVASDAEFLRRIYLDLLGTIPSSAEARLFLEEVSADKRQQLVNRTIEDPRLNHRLANVFDLMLMERIGDGQVKSSEWRKYLYDSFVANKPYNILAREILSASGVDAATRPAARFYLDRAGETNRLTRDVGRMFLGMDMQCAQCHDHPLVDSYYQSDYYGLFAFLNRSYIFTDASKKKYFAEKSVGNVSFKSVFTEEAGETGPHLPGDVPVAEPVLKKLEEYQVRPRANTVPVPAFSRRGQLALLATNGGNSAFNRNIANRLWGLMNGHALVMPVDLQHVDNPPLNPELMDVLEKGIVEVNFDVKAFLREIALSKIYQRGYQLDMQSNLNSADIQVKIDQVTAESEQSASETTVAQQSWETVKKQMSELEIKWAEARAAYVKADAAAAAQLDKYLKQDGNRVTASEALTVRTPKRDALAAAEAGIQKALKNLPAEKGLTDAAALFKKKLDVINAEVTKLEATRAKAEGSGKEELEKLTPLQTALDEAWSAWEPGRNEYHVVDTEEQRLRNVYENLQTRTAALERQESRFSRIKVTAELREQRLAQAQQLQATTKSIENNTLKVAADKKRLVVLQSNKQVAEKAHQQATIELTTVRKQRDDKKQAVELMTGLIAATNSAIKPIATDGDVVTAVQQLNQQQIRLGSEVAEANKNVSVAEGQVTEKAKRLEAAETMVADMNGVLKNDEAALATLRQQQANEQQELASLAEQEMESTEKLSRTLVREFLVSDLKPLTPEQLANTVMESLGVTESFRVQVTAEIDKKNPLSDADREDSDKVARRQREISEGVHAKSAALQAEFVKLYGASAGQVQTDFFSTIDQALFVTNGSRIKDWVNSNSYLVGQLDKIDEVKDLADQLYISLLCRYPSEQEFIDVKEYLSARGEQKAEAVREIVWALLASTEFRFNH